MKGTFKICNDENKKKDLFWKNTIIPKKTKLSTFDNFLAEKALISEILFSGNKPAWKEGKKHINAL